MLNNIENATYKLRVSVVFLIFAFENMCVI